MISTNAIKRSHISLIRLFIYLNDAFSSKHITLKHANGNNCWSGVVDCLNGMFIENGVEVSFGS